MIALIIVVMGTFLGMDASDAVIGGAFTGAVIGAVVCPFASFLAWMRRRNGISA